MTELPSKHNRRRVGLIAIAASIAAVAGGALVFAHSGGGHHGPMSGNSARHHEHIQAMLGRIGATDAQKAQIEGILEPALADMKAAHESHSAAFRQFHEAMAAPSIDRARLESLRAEQIKSFDEISKRLVTALSDAAEVLSPEQRAALARTIEEHHRG
ncbi:MAG TPA: Spy/CpxP family protein refolding chaperone [Steroidobacteraceae bacterium]|nr:Spy/CpxP family protein refolding chaperone [Steroidobacteraceae bacterium]